MEPLSTERLRLRAFTESDVQFVREMHSHPGMAQFLAEQANPDLEKASEQLARFRSYADEPVHGMWCVCLPDGTPVALVMFKPIPWSTAAGGEDRPRDTEIGWRQHPDHDGNGYVTEAARAVLDHAWRSGLTRVVAVTAPDNLASQAVCLRLGMTDDGTTDDYYDEPGLRLFVARL